MVETFNKPAAIRGRYGALHVLNGLLLAGLWLFAMVAYAYLPEQIPAHVGTSGVTRWTSRESGLWFLLPLLGTFEMGLMYALSRLADAGPQGLNVPQKKRLLALPRDGQRYALEPTLPFMYAMATWLLLLMALIQWQLFAAARAGADARAGGMLAVVLVCVLAPLLGVYWLNGAVRRRIDEWLSRADAAGAGAGRAQ